MGSEMASVAPPTMEVPMVEAEAVRQMRDLAANGWGAKRIARELGVARNTVRRYLRGAVADLQSTLHSSGSTRSGERKRSRCSTARLRATPWSSRRCSASAASRRA